MTDFSPDGIQIVGLIGPAVGEIETAQQHLVEAHGFVAYSIDHAILELAYREEAAANTQVPLQDVTERLRAERGEDVLCVMAIAEGVRMAERLHRRYSYYGGIVLTGITNEAETQTILNYPHGSAVYIAEADTVHHRFDAIKSLAGVTILTSDGNEGAALNQLERAIGLTHGDE